MTDEEKQAAKAAKHAAVALPSGGFEVEDVLDALDKAATSDDRDVAIAEAITAAQVDAPTNAESGTLDGLKVVDAPHPEIEGLVERTQVRDVKDVDFNEIKPGKKPDPKSDAADTAVSAINDAKGDVK